MWDSKEFDKVFSEVDTNKNNSIIEIHTGCWYLTASGTLTNIVMNTKSMYKSSTEYIDIYHTVYDFMGKCAGKPHLDIIAEIPESLRFYMLRSIESYHTSKMGKKVINSKSKQ